MTDPGIITAVRSDEGAEKPFPTIGKSLVLIVLYFILQIAMTLLVMAISVPGAMQPTMDKQAEIMSDPQAAIGVVWGLVAAGLVMLAVIGWNLREPARAIRIGLFTPSRLSLAETALTAFTLLIGAFFFNWAYATYIVPGVELQAELQAILKALDTSTMGLILKVMAIAVLAPLIEELLFRGYLQTALMEKMNHHVAIWLAALIFSVIHLQPMAIPGLMLLGAAFGYIYHRTGSLKTCILLHMVNNGLALAVGG
jgi:uncharacterized protein